jgi:hypothetical protein
MINNRTRVAIVGAVLITVLILGGPIGLPKAFGIPPEVVPPECVLRPPSDEYFQLLTTCYIDNLTPTTCCPGGGETNAHMAIACILSTCGPGNITPDPPGSIASVADFLRTLFGVGADSCNPCIDPTCSG